MKITLWNIRLNAVLALLALVSADAQNLAEISQVMPFAVSGSVSSGTITLPNPEKPAPVTPGSTSAAPAAPVRSVQKRLDAVTSAGGQINTGADGAASLFLGDVGAVRMGAESEVRVPAQTEKGHSLEMLKGRLFLNVSGEDLRKRNTEFKLKTPAALLAVKGTKFFSVSKDGVDTVGVHEGSVVVTEPESGKSTALDAGFAMNVSRGTLGEKRTLDASEALMSGEYQKAGVMRVPLTTAMALKGGGWVGRVWQHKLTMFKEGKQVVETFQERGYKNLDPCVITNEWSGNVSMTPEGLIRHSWKPREGTQDVGHLYFSLEGMGQLKGVNNKSVIEIIGIRARYRGVNVASGRAAFVGDRDRTFVGGLLRENSGAVFLEVSLNGGWKSMIIPSSTEAGGGPRTSISFDWLPQKHRDIRFPTPPQSTVDLTDFELLIAD